MLLIISLHVFLKNYKHGSCEDKDGVILNKPTRHNEKQIQ